MIKNIFIPDKDNNKFGIEFGVELNYDNSSNTINLHIHNDIYDIDLDLQNVRDLIDWLVGIQQMMEEENHYISDEIKK